MTDRRTDGRTDRREDGKTGRRKEFSTARLRAGVRMAFERLGRWSGCLPAVPSSRLPVFLLALAACGGPDATQTFSPGDARVTAEQVIGQWSAELTDSLPCPDTLASRTLVFGVGGDPGDVGPGGTLNFTSTWSAGTDPGGGVAGTVNLVNGQIELRLFRDGYSQAAGFNGFIGSDGVLVGLLTDPYTGYPPLFGGSACLFKVAAERVASP
ncbi:MAG TPA: hypothetical protein VFL95_07590 [Gemmatimonadales bacterium]|nr:hypothetical protein [Gemmatimonadales bacterium]